MQKFSLLVLLAIVVAACSSSPTPIADDTTPLVDYVGLTTEQARTKAEKAGVPFRVVEEDGTMLPATMDYRPGRINAAVTKGIVTSYAVEGDENDAAYDENSWKTMIPSSCVSFFDGCNNCTRMEGSTEAACTRMFCETYQKPECRDTK